MSLPNPETGLVICYSYLWQRESAAGELEGRKDRPCAILAIDAAKERVFVCPISHTKPGPDVEGIAIPPQISKRLGLDSEQSWLVISETNHFAWPGYDVRPVSKTKDAYGFLPPKFYGQIHDRFVERANERKLALVKRDEALERASKKMEQQERQRPDKDNDKKR